MAIANSTDGIWVNPDGLRVRMTARAEAAMGSGGEFQEGVGHQHLTEFHVDYATIALGTTDTNVYILDYNNYLPDSAVVDRIEFVVGNAWTNGTGDNLLNFGLVKRSDFTTIIDADGLVNSLADNNIDTDGQTTVIVGPTDTYAGALMGVQVGIGFDAVVCAYWETNAPTAGTGQLKIYWRDNNFAA